MNDFDLLRDTLSAQGAPAALDRLIELLRQRKEHHELFEALKMRVRHNLGLPLVYSDLGDTLSDEQRTKLEDGLLAACREVGTALIQAGRIREGWMYLRPVGDKAEAARLLSAIEADEDNYEELIEVLLHEGVDVGRGFGLVLDEQGVCNAITTYDQILPRRPKGDQQAAGRLLLRRLHADLLANVQADVARQEGQSPRETTLAGLVADRDWLFHDNAYHIDTTHLASTVRIARVLDSADEHRLALDLTAYGRRLSGQFQYQGDEPFVDVYPSHALFFQALLGENVDEALEYFRTKAEMLDPQYHGPVAVEVYVDLLARIGRPADALVAAIQWSRDGAQPMGIAPSLYELSQRAGNFEPMLQHCRARHDLLGYVAALTAANK